MDSGNHYHIKHQQWHSGFFLQHEQEDKEFIQRRWDDAVEAVWPKDRPYAPSKMDVALADFHSHCLPFLLAEDPKLVQLIQVARTLGSTYKPPSRDLISGKYLDVIHETSWKQQLALLLSEARIYGVNVFGNGTTIKTVVLVNVLAAGVNNPFALLDIADCTGHLATREKKDARCIADIVKPLIRQKELELGVHNKRYCQPVF